MGGRRARPPVRKCQPDRAYLVQRRLSVQAPSSPRARIDIPASLPADTDATDYLRAVLKSGEMSPRVLKLTERVIRMNPAHYTAW